jgi:hypothetical protein
MAVDVLFRARSSAQGGVGPGAPCALPGAYASLLNSCRIGPATLLRTGMALLSAPTIASAGAVQ